jgi:CRP-like cAMP-binding protein
MTAQPSAFHFARSPVIAKLEAFTRLASDDAAALDRACRNIRFVDARCDLIAEGVRPRHVHVVLDGWAARCRMLADGAKQIVSLLLPGDFCDINASILKVMDHSITALSRLKVATMTRDEMSELAAGRPPIAQALCWHELVDAAIQREWTVNLGQRNAYERLGHLLVELYLRLETVGRAGNGACDFPLTQNDLADATGLTSVHVNRTLQELRRDGLIALERKRLHILDLDRLMDVSMFNPAYLHLNHEGSQLQFVA